LVNAIEKVAMSQGASKISLESSLNAVEFYKKCGYQRKQSSSYLCKGGVTLETVSFEKVLNS
jgi:histone acetyltransferase (RNA polymerase elongator complex component)